MVKISRVALVGGTHGNEFIGAYLIHKFQHHPDQVQRPSFSTDLVLGNPRAFEAGRRYIDTDLNRCFLQQDLQNSALKSYEEQRAKAMNEMLGPKGNSQVDFLLDLHSSTANMGLTLILVNDHPFNLELAGYLTQQASNIRVYRWTQPGQENAFVNSLCELGFSIEVGPIAQGTLRADLFQQTEVLVGKIMDYLDQRNRGQTSIAETVTVYQHMAVVDYPKNSQGQLQAMIHPQLQEQDYQSLSPGSPMFLTFAGKTIVYEGDETVWPIFINEAAYYEKGIAMCLTQKRILSCR